MGVLIAYKTKHNTTKQYATWIHNEVESDIVNLDDISRVNLDNYDVIVIGSWIFDDIIVASDYIKKNWDKLESKKVILFVNGLTDPRDEKMTKIYKNSLPSYIRLQIHFFPIGGKLSFANISLWDRIVLKFRGKFRETNQIQESAIRPIVVKIYDLKING